MRHELFDEEFQTELGTIFKDSTVGKSPISPAKLGLATIMVVILLQGLFSQWELMNHLFRTVPLTLIQGAICIAVGFPIILVGVLFRRFDLIV